MNKPLFDIDQIKTSVIETQQSSWMMLINGSHASPAVPFFPRDDADKFAMIQIARRAAEHVKATEAWLVFEAWLVKQQVEPGTSWRDMRKQLPESLAEVPGRVEALVCQHEISEGPTGMWFFEIIRDGEGKIADLREFNDERGPGQVFRRSLWIITEPNDEPDPCVTVGEKNSTNTGIIL